MTTHPATSGPAEQTFYIIDFDSTFTKVEALDVLGEISLIGRPDRDDARWKLAYATSATFRKREAGAPWTTPISG